MGASELELERWPASGAAVCAADDSAKILV